MTRVEGKPARIKDTTTQYPDWHGPYYPRRVELLQQALDRGIKRPTLDHAARYVAGFELERIEGQPVTYRGVRQADTWRVAYVYALPRGGKAAIFIPHGSGTLHTAVYANTKRADDDAELAMLVSVFLGVIEST